MKRAVLFAAVSALVLSACAAHQSLPQAAETADTDASVAYASIANIVNAYESLPSTKVDQITAAEALKRKAWTALQVERQAYAMGQGVDLTGLNSLLAQAKALGN